MTENIHTCSKDGYFIIWFVPLSPWNSQSTLLRFPLEYPMIIVGVGMDISSPVGVEGLPYETDSDARRLA